MVPTSSINAVLADKEKLIARTNEVLIESTLDDPYQVDRLLNVRNARFRGLEGQGNMKDLQTAIER